MHNPRDKESAVAARDMITEALIRLRFLQEMAMAWDVRQVEIGEETLAAIGWMLDEVVERIERVDQTLDLQ